MMIQLAYGSTHIGIDVSDVNLLGVFEPQDSIAVLDENLLLKEAMANPIGTPRLRELVKPGQQIAIITSDISRPCPSDRLLPYIITELEAAGVADDNIFIVLALGIHRPMTSREISVAVSTRIQARFRVFNHDLQDVVPIGVTSRGTPVEIFRPVVEADVRICLGNLEYHYFAGFSGGAKVIFPGLASRDSIVANHGLMVQPGSAAGRLEGNPLRMDLEEAVGLLGADFILNVVVDHDHHITGAAAGDLKAAHRAGCQMVVDRGSVIIPELADIVVASAGGFPKDINFLQAHKALESTKYAVCEGGILILAAECAEGIGNQVFEEWLLEYGINDDVIERIQREFVLGGHKVAALAKVLKRAGIYLVSALPDEIVRRGGMLPFDEPQQALDTALSELGEHSTVIVLPEGASVMPRLA